MVDVVMEVNPRWHVDTQELHVSTLIRVAADGQNKLLMVLRFFFCSWANFTITRWASVHRSVRLWIGSLLVGFDGWFALCQADPKVSGYMLNGFVKGKNPLVRSYAVSACFVGMVTEGAGVDLLRDDRFLLRAKQHWQTMVDDMGFAAEVPAQIWEWLGQIAGEPACPVADVRGQALWSCLASLAYCHRDSFERLDRLPLSLTQGDLRANLQHLSSMPYHELNDEFSKCMRMSIELGVDLSVLERLLRLCREAPCCTNLVEQGHGSGAATLKSHALFGTRSLQVRAAIHQCRVFFSSLPIESKLE
ncbi:unnamed protein product [Prorocentrum cordatum]|uniref:Nuclear pore complex protein Nup85 n=1 Tax=Prorocentrum cordatum TaxID=2364126 RepID=A0ABN9VR55_9DINO|nr:unnamed protein product [Polarella glacialis]